MSSSTPAPIYTFDVRILSAGQWTAPSAFSATTASEATTMAERAAGGRIAVDRLEARYVGPYVLIEPTNGEALGMQDTGRIDLVHPHKATRYPTLASALNARKHFGPDLDVLPASWLDHGCSNATRNDAREIDQWKDAQR